MKKIVLLSFCLTLGLSVFGYQSNNTLARLQTLIDSVYDSSTDFGGATIGMVDQNGTSFSLSVGMADVEAHIKMEPSHVLLGGSTGKVFVSSSILLLVQEGKIKLDDKASVYLSGNAWFPKIQNSETITIRNLLQHSTGISRYVFNEQFQKDLPLAPDRVWKPEELLSYVFDEKPLFAAGESFAYSDTNYIILGMIIEKVTGKSLWDFIDDKIIKPHHLTNIYPQNSRTIPSLASGYSSDTDEFYPGKVSENGVYKQNVQFEWAGGGYAMNATSLSQMAKLMYEGHIFSASLFDDYFKGIEAVGLGGQWGLGVHMRQTPFGMSWGHSGFFPGYITSMLYFPDKKTAITVQVNTSDPTKLSLFRKIQRLIPSLLKELE